MVEFRKPLIRDKAENVNARRRIVERLQFVRHLGARNIEIDRLLRAYPRKYFFQEPEHRIQIRRVRKASHKEQTLALLIAEILFRRETVPDIGGQGLHAYGLVDCVNCLALVRRGIETERCLPKQRELDALPVSRGIPVLCLPGQLVLAALPQEVEVVTVVKDADGSPLLNEVDVLARNVRAVQIDKVQICRVFFDPVPDALLHRRAVEHLNAELRERRRVGLLRRKVVAEELDLIALLHKHFQVLPGRAAARVLVKGRHIVIHHEDNLFALAPLARPEGIRIAVIFKLFGQFLLPLLF